MVVGLGAATIASSQANLGETERQITARYGEPVKIQNGYWERVFTYHWEKYEVGVTFMDGKSQHEFYQHTDKKTPLTEQEVQLLLTHNSSGRPWHLDAQESYVLGDKQIEAKAWYIDQDTKRILSVFTTAFDQKFLREPINPRAEPTGKELRFTGVLWLTHKQDGNYITLHSGSDILEIPWTRRYLLQWVQLPVGETCRVVVQDDEIVNVEPPMVFRSDREHRSRKAMADDSFSVYPLVRIQQGDRVIWDRSVCEVHHIKMNEITADIAYGTFVFEGSEKVCNEQYPHHFDFAFGGDPVPPDDLNAPRVTQIYVCPKCAAECQIYKWMNPDFVHDY